MSALYTTDSFTSQYGYPPQEYFNKCVLGDAAAVDLPDLYEQLAVAQANAAKTAGWETSGDAAIMANGANNDTNVGNLQEIIKARLWHQAFAKQFLSGFLADYGPYLGSTGQQLIKAGLLDTTLKP